MGLGGEIAGFSPEKAKENAAALGVISLIPPLLAVVLAFLTKEVVTSLLAGSAAGFYLLASMQSPGISHLAGNLVSTTTLFCRALIAVMSDPWKCGVLLLCLGVGGLIAVINRTGGFVAFAKKLTARAATSRAACLIAQALGLIIFFDDYANSLIVGPVMRPITDKMKVSRERLAYIVDSTAAPVSGIAIISSWIAAELSAIESGFKLAGVEASAYNTFIGSVPYSFYNLFCLGFVFLGIYMMRDYGPMLRAEVRARGGEPLRRGSLPTESTILKIESQSEHAKEGSVWAAILPVVLLCTLAFVGFYRNGLQNARVAGLLNGDEEFSLHTLSVAFGSADTSFVLLSAVVVASLLAIMMGTFSRRFTFVKGVEIFIEGAQQLLVTAIILALSWSLAFAVERLGTCYFIVEIVTLGLPYWLVPSMIFLTCCLVSFAAGSYGTMLIVMPMAVPIAYSVAGGSGIGHAEQFIFACVAAVLSGSIFGDHCSPITDTTILSSIGAGCENMDHVKTQLPYALTVAGISTLLGTLPAGLGVPVWISLTLGLGACALVLRLFGKNPDKIYNVH